MQWVDLLQDLTGWWEPRWECDWTETEAALGTSLPSDYKELCARFGPGCFAEYLMVLADRGPGRESMLAWWQGDVGLFEDDPESMDMMFGPYEVYGVNERRGIILWACSEPEGRIFWLADAEKDPDTWPIVAKLELAPGEEWYRFELPTSEFIYRALTDPDFGVFSVDKWEPGLPRTFERSGD